MLAGASLISFSAVFVAASNVSASSSAFYRMFIGSIVIFAWIAIRRIPLKPVKPAIPSLALAGLFFTLDLAFWHQSILYVGPGLGTLLANLQVFFMPLIAVFLFREHLHSRYFIGAMLAIGGLWLQLGLNWDSFTENYRLGVIFGILTAIAYTAYMLSMKRVQAAASSARVEANLAVMGLVTMVLLALLMLLQGQDFSVPDTKSWAYLLAYGTLCQVLGWILIVSAMPKLTSMTAGLLLLLQPTLSFCWDILFFDRQLSLPEGIGVLLTLAGIYFGLTRKAAKA